MRRLFPLSIATVLFVVACAPSEATPSTTVGNAPGATVTPSTATTTAPTGSDSGEPTTTSAPEDTLATSGRPLAPDFTLALGDGGSYTLSDGDKPVYLVFWAEW